MEDLKIRRRTEEMIAYAYIAVRQFPKAERHVLSAGLVAAALAGFGYIWLSAP